MRILFLHDNFPAQFGVFGQYMASKGCDVWFGTQREGVSLQGLKVFSYAPHRRITEKIHPYAASYERAVLTGQSVARVALQLKKKGFSPDIVIAHSGWGPGLFVKDVWPEAIYAGYFEWYYRPDSPDVVYLSQDKRTIDEDLRVRSRNASILMDLTHCKAGLCPTNFQKEQFPSCFHETLTVLHDGIDTNYYKPDSGKRLMLPNFDLSHVDELITYVARGMEPYRGFPEFVKAMEIVLRDRPQAHAVIVGDDRVAYGKQLPKGDSYKKRALAECDLDWKRVHFTGPLPRSDYLKVLQASAVHVYLTVPFVLSWSMMEAMSAGCALVASDVAPVREIYDQNSQSMKLVDHKNSNEVARAINNLLDDREARAAYGAQARRNIVENYSAESLFKQKFDWISAL